MSHTIITQTHLKLSKTYSEADLENNLPTPNQAIFSSSLTTRAPPRRWSRRGVVLNRRRPTQPQGAWLSYKNKWKRGEIEETSKVLVSIGSEGFLDQLVDSSKCQLLLVVHDSLFLLAGIKEKYDKVKCWQGELIYVPEKWRPLDVVFLYFLPALSFNLDQVFGALAKLCLRGARVVISHPQGRDVLKQQQQQNPDVIISDLPKKMTLQKVAADHSFDVAEFVDEPGFYLAVLKFSDARN
ncbi:uncharacterized protein LOC142634699 [Castanea sativa]|uniref:uncharacterized protein LOC142634699 n=1 Tax=Castanea sativa TaxID=21020 RepID=UPI003F64AFC2